MKAYIPIVLIYSRLVMGLGILLLSWLQVPQYPIIAIALLIIGLLTDVFDGIIARQLSISTQKLRRLDSAIDQIFFVCFAIATYLQCPDFFKTNALLLGLLFGIEALTYLVSYVKFRKEIATHSIGAKIWTLLLVATLVQIIAQCQSGWLFTVCFWVGVVTRIEIIAIVLTLNTWTNDVPSIYHALQLRRGKAIRRNKLFNG